MTALFNNKYCRVDHDDQSSCEFVLDYDKAVLAVEELKKSINDWKVVNLIACRACQEANDRLHANYLNGKIDSLNLVLSKIKEVFGEVKK